MGLFKLKSALVGIATMLAAQAIFAEAVIDKTFDDNQNDFEFYWYYYDDNAGVGPNDRPQLFPDLTPSVINVPSTEKNRGGYDGTDATDTWQVKVYTFQPGEHLSKKCATMPFTFGDPWEADYCAAGKACAVPFVGLGTMLCEEGKGIDLTGVEAIHFFAKSRVNTLNEVYVKVQTLDIDLYSQKAGSQMNGDEFGYYGKTISVEAGDWQEFTIPIEDLDIPSWAADYDFDITKCTKLGWEIKGDGIITGDTIDVADVYFTGTYEFVSPSMWPKEESTRPAGGWFSTFDQAPPNQSGLKTYWYAYNDVEIGGNSAVDPTTAYQDATTGKLSIEFIDGTGFGNLGQGAALVYTLGAPIPRDTITILGFVGIGCNLYDSAKVEYWDATTEGTGVSSVYFEYFTDAGAKKLTMELSDMNDVGDMANPTRKEMRGSGIVYYRDFPATNGAWRRVLIPFDSLVTHSTWKGYNHIPLDKTKLAKIQWKVQAGDGTSGAFAIDNIAFPGADFKLDPPEDVGVDKVMTTRSVAKGFTAAFANNAIRVSFAGASKLAHGKIMLINTRGAMVSSSNIAGGRSISTGISTAALPSGMYFVRLSAIDVAGKAVVMQAPVSIVK
jgi:hypothetical protein